MINALRNNKMTSFRDKYRNMDVLLVDDIQFLVEQRAHAGGVLPHLQRVARVDAADRDRQ